jgi:purine-binding chemotaxis protein CheW
VLGVLNLRGTIVPILDMRLAYGLEPAYGGETVSIVLNIDQHVVGLVVDAVSDVVALTEQEIRPAPQVAGSVDGASVVLSR